ncbi:MAG TPA: PBP1A family penicillin-binding protein, partial [Pyrinomonadaceae bacterium]|nr:PBP1A family penicillin-binding protein [Pyrinomonadaceae bacterium]
MAIEITSERREARRLPRLLKTRRSVAATHKQKTRDWFRLLRFAVVFALALSVAAFASIIYCYNTAADTIDRRLASGYLTSRAGLYAAPRVLRAGQKLERERLVETLRRAGYVEESASDVWSGAFRVTDEGAVEISPRRAPAAAAERAPEGFTPEVVRVAFDRKGRIADITGDGVTLDAFVLEPEALTNDAATKTGTRATLAYADIPPVLSGAIRAIEDRRFFEHHGIDATGIGRALLSWTGDATGGTAPERQGGSTITQQLVKNTYLTPERTLRRKFNEALLAAALERRLSKEDIFALYCNEIYLGQRGAFAVRGVKQAARVYFGKELKDLSLAEAATIAGMIQSPARYAPDRHAEDARARRNAVLAAMVRDNSITEPEARAAMNEAVTVVPVDPHARATAPYFVDYVNRAVEAQLRAVNADERSLRVHTTIDLDLQQLAEQAVARGLAQLDKVYKHSDRRPQAALVALDPQTGHVFAMVGGKNYAESQLNRATDARRQPGSVFKPFVYAAALESGISPARMFTDAPRAFIFDRYGAPYRPANYGGNYSMRDVTMRAALTRSLNVVTVDLAMQTGLPRVAALAEKFGLQKIDAAYPSLALGTSEATPLEIASAYTAFANAGARTRPSAITRAADGEGTRLFEEFAPAATASQVVSPSTAYMITDMLTNVVAEGTARGARGMLKLSAVAGKTGTSRDGWFVGYTPQLVCVVWIGFDDNTQLGLTGAESALPVWEEFVRGAVELRPELGGAAFMR